RLSSEIPNDARIRWRSSSVKPEYLDTVAIVAPADSVPLGAPFLLRARGRSNLGRDMPLRVANWASLSQNVAGVDSLGQLIPIREGSVTVTLSAGGWRQVSRTFVVVPQASRLIATEDWTKGLTNMWIAFGHPFPKTLTDSVLGHAFLNNGD